jgi:DNA mismatch endonuclease, patch repair protein
MMERGCGGQGGADVSEIGVDREPGTAGAATDVFTREKRSEIMARVRNKNTRPEMVVRSVLHAMGYRYRLHGRDLPGSPDIVFPKRRTVIFVHGCFWHGHEGCGRAKRPTGNAAFWNEKIDLNMARDAEAAARLTEAGWRVHVVWQCRISEAQVLGDELRAFLDGEGASKKEVQSRPNEN